MIITEAHIPLIEKALGIKLYDNQKSFLLGTGRLGFDRQTGRTTAHCIKLALSDGPDLDSKKPEEYADMTHLRVIQHMSYSRGVFRPEFMNIRDKLKQVGFQVRGVK